MPGIDRGVLEQLYVRLEKPLFNVVYRWVWDVETARDLVQEAFARVWNHRARVAPPTAQALLFQTALNLAANRRRSKRLWGWLGLETADHVSSSDPGVEEQLATAQRQAAVRRAVDSLPERSKRVLMMCELSEMTYDEVARVLGVPAGTVASRRHAAMERLGELLRAEESR